MLNPPPPTPKGEVLTEEEAALLRKMARKIVERRMTAPALLFLESYRPLNYIGSQLMLVLAPLLNIFFTLPEWDKLRIIMERRESVGLFLDMLDDEEGEYLLARHEEKEREKREKAEKKAGTKTTKG